MDRRLWIGVAAAATGAAALAARRRGSPELVRRAVTINLSRDEVAARWNELGGTGDVRFEQAPGDRGTEVLVEARGRSAVDVEDELRRFKQLVEAGEVARSDAASDGDSLVRQLFQRAAQPIGAR